MASDIEREMSSSAFLAVMKVAFLKPLSLFCPLFLRIQELAKFEGA